MKICSEVQNFMGKMNFWSKCAKVSWLLRYSVFSVFTKISWPIFLSKLRFNQAGYNIFEDMPGFGLLNRFQKGSNFWKSNIQQLTYKQNIVWLVFELNQNVHTFLNFWSHIQNSYGQNFDIELKNWRTSQNSTLIFFFEILARYRKKKKN